MKNQEFNKIINNFNLFIQLCGEKATSQNTLPQGQQLRDVFAQYRQAPQASQSPKAEQSRYYVQGFDTSKLVIDLGARPVTEFDREFLQLLEGYLNSDRSCDDLYKFGDGLCRLAYIKRQAESK